jgi:hypothetical protein
MVGMTIYGCARDEAIVFEEIAPRYGVVPTLAEAPASESNVALAARIGASASVIEPGSRIPPCAH